MRNPFYHRQAVSDPSQVFGRAGLVRQLFDLMESGQSCAVVGERRIGKSTLLAYLASPTVQGAHGLDPDLLLTGSLDFLALHGLSPDELWPEILEALSMDAVDPEVRSTLEREAEATELRFSAFRRTLRRLRRNGYRVALLCDELDLAVNNPDFDEAFFGALRSLAGEGVVFVTASRASLLELEQYRSEEARRKVLASPFFNIFAEFNLGPFEGHEVAEWLAASLEPMPIRFDALDIAWLDGEAGRHPFFLQLAAYHLFGELERTGLGRVAHPRPEESGKASDRASRREGCRHRASEQVRREGAKIFRHQWRHSRSEERGLLARLATADGHREPWVASLEKEVGGDVRRSRALGLHTLQRLERRGLVRRYAAAGPPGNGTPWRLFSRPFTDWLLARASVSILAKSAGAETVAPQGIDPPGTDAPRGGPEGAGVEEDAGPSWARTSTVMTGSLEASSVERFQMLEELGQGGTATVYKAWDLRLERLVALKVLDAALRGDPDGLRALLDEARVCAGLRHPNIVMVHDIDPEAGFLVEEFLSGGSLRDLLEQLPVLLPHQLLQLAGQLAAALDAAHAAGIIHGDLKPDNVLLVERADLRESSGLRRLPDLKLGDFGTAVRGRSTAVSGAEPAIFGTLAYMAPEQLSGRHLTPAADVYAFGVVLWEAKFGTRPDDGATLVASPPADAFDQLLLACLAREPTVRPADGGALRSAVHRVARELAVPVG